MIVSSTYTEGPPQADGRRWVTERHITANGDDVSFEWLGLQDVQLVMSARAAALNVQYAAQAEAEALVAGARIPLSHVQFRDLFGDKKTAIDAFNAKYEQHPALSDEQKDGIRTGLEDFRRSTYVARPFIPQVLQMVGLYEALGLLTEEDAARILGAGNG